MILDRTTSRSPHEREEYNPHCLAQRCVEATRLTEALLPHERLYVDGRANQLIDVLRRSYGSRRVDGVRALTSHQVDQRIAYDIATLRISLGRKLLKERTPSTLVE